MSENPDIVYQKATEEYNQRMGLSSFSRVPKEMELRFIERGGKRVLQQWQWSHEEKDFGWWDIPLMEEENAGQTSTDDVSDSRG